MFEQTIPKKGFKINRYLAHQKLWGLFQEFAGINVQQPYIRIES